MRRDSGDKPVEPKGPAGFRRFDAIRQWYESGEAWACALYVQLMGCLVGVIQAWAALHTEPS